MRKIPVALVGATGMTGQQFVALLHDHPFFELQVLTASSRSAGKSYREVAKWYIDRPMPERIAQMKVVNTTVDGIFRHGEVKVIFCGLPSGVAREIEPELAKHGMTVFSDAGCFRMEADMPVLIPEANPDHLDLLPFQRTLRGWTGGIVKNPNCTLVGTVMTLKPLLRYGVKQVYLSSMQALSGAGYDGVPSMAIIDNVIPYIADEEGKVEAESLKILGRLDTAAGTVVPHGMGISASCHRVGTLYGHLSAVFVEFEGEVDLDEIKEAIRGFRSEPQTLELPTAPREPLRLFEDPFRPQPRLDRDLGEPERCKGMAVAVGRVRYDSTGKHRIKLINLSHNTIRGAAGNSVLSAELAVRRGFV
ncbi:MAG: aspartate-semialdehyde dehydrogenase [Candidatus Latescibacteria bacterium]|nr:aspartate-semialdehyde dehydrogenase [Candidatus Latescibacterota bacterium]